jgi:hypothetical protein
LLVAKARFGGSNPRPTSSSSSKVSSPVPALLSAGPTVRIRLPPAGSPERTRSRSAAR